MHVIKIGEVKKEAATSSLFTGPEVTRQVLLPESKEFNADVVNFGKGVRNKFHAHDGEQILIVTSGKGYITTEAEKKLIVPGDVVIIPAGEKHWHGAVEDSEFSHIYVSRLGGRITQLEE
ncbi:MAG: cupin domain-containing protein [Desulfobacca sp.]|nr:cupin domain-containing protein [Desulfobacca sp.]